MSPKDTPKYRRTYLAIAVLLIGLSCWVTATWIWNPFAQSNATGGAPRIDWRPFARAEAERLVDDGNLVLLFGKPIGYTNDGEYAAKSFNDPELRRLSYEGCFVPMILEYDNWDGPEISGVFQEFGHTKYAFAMLFAPNRKPVKLAPHSAEDMLSNIYEAMSLHSP